MAEVEHVKLSESVLFLISHASHDVSLTFYPPKLEREARPQRMVAGNHPGSRQASSLGYLIEPEAYHVWDFKERARRRGW
jgi:hypothetical protein